MFEKVKQIRAVVYVIDELTAPYLSRHQPYVAECIKLSKKKKRVSLWGSG